MHARRWALLITLAAGCFGDENALTASGGSTATSTTVTGSETTATSDATSTTGGSPTTGATSAMTGTSGETGATTSTTTSTSTTGPGTSTTSTTEPGTGTTGTTEPGTGTTEPGTGTTGAPVCPDNGPPPGPAVRKFDVATLNCPGEPCPADADQCMCPLDFAALDVGPAHFMATGTDNNKMLVWGAGNFQAMYVDDLNTDWQQGGKARADALMASAAANFDCGEPEWFIVNEISASQWPDNATYRQFVVDFAEEMKSTYGKSVVIAAPFDKPGANGASWAALAQHAFIAAEIYLSGKEVNASGNSVAWCKTQYQSGVDAYVALGVPKTKLFLVEHFGQTTSDKGWGRAGVSTAGWHNAIAARSQAAQQIGFAGFISYAWSWNLMHVADDERLAFMATYTAQSLP